MTRKEKLAMRKKKIKSKITRNVTVSFLTDATQNNIKKNFQIRFMGGYKGTVESLTVCIIDVQEGK